MIPKDSKTTTKEIKVFNLGEVKYKSTFKLKIFSKKRFIDLFIAVLIIANLVLIYFVSVNTILRNIVLPNVHANNVDLSLSNIKNISTKYEDNFKNLLNTNINISIGEDNYNVKLSDINLKIDEAKIVDYGKGSDIVKVIGDGIKLIKGQNINVGFNIDSKLLLSKSSTNFNSNTPSIISNYSTLNCVKNNYNFNINSDELNNEFTDAINNNKNLIIKLNKILNTEDYKLYSYCNSYFSDIVKIENKSNNLITDSNIKDLVGAQIINGSIYYSVLNNSNLLNLLINYKKNNDIQVVQGDYEINPDNIYLMKPYLYGKSLNIEDTIRNISAWINNPEQNIPLVFNQVNPIVLNYNKPILDFSKLISTGKTRIDLIRDGAFNQAVPFTVYGLQEVDRVIIQPHQEFSYIKTIKPEKTRGGDWITKSGYLIFGGICNSTTTLFRAALEAGMPITDRSYHFHNVASYSWGPYPMNIVDAAYYTDPVVDLKFINDYNYPVMIKINIDKQSDYQYNTVYLYSSQNAPLRSVSYSNWKIWDKYTPKIFKASFDRIVKEGSNILRQDNFYSRYL